MVDWQITVSLFHGLVSNLWQKIFVVLARYQITTVCLLLKEDNTFATAIKCRWIVKTEWNNYVFVFIRVKRLSKGRLALDLLERCCLIISLLEEWIFHPFFKFIDKFLYYPFGLTLPISFSFTNWIRNHPSRGMRAGRLSL